MDDRTDKVHLDGYNQMDMTTRTGPSTRHETFYFGESALGAVRIDDFKYRFIDQPNDWAGEKVHVASRPDHGAIARPPPVDQALRQRRRLQPHPQRLQSRRDRVAIPLESRTGGSTFVASTRVRATMGVGCATIQVSMRVVRRKKRLKGNGTIARGPGAPARVRRRQMAGRGGRWIGNEVDQGRPEVVH